MAMRLSFALDPETVDLIDQYANKRAIKREKAVLELIEAGITHVQEGGVIKIEQKRSFEEFKKISEDIDELKETVSGLTTELHAIHHIIQKEKDEEASIIPYQTPRWWDFWIR